MRQQFEVTLRTVVRERYLVETEDPTTVEDEFNPEDALLLGSTVSSARVVKVEPAEPLLGWGDTQ